MNRYLTALLVVLAATGMEAQTYESALNAALGHESFEEICRQPAFKDLETDILSVIKALKATNDQQEHEPSTCKTFFALPSTAVNADSKRCTISDNLPSPVRWKDPATDGVIHIRAPSC